MAMMWVLHDYQPNATDHLLYVSAACIVANWLAKCRDLPFWLSVIGMAQAVFGIAQWLGWNPWGYELAWYLNKPSGFFGQETILGAFLIACFAPALFTRRFWAAVPIALCIVATHSSMTAAGVGVVGLLWVAQVWSAPAALALLSAAASALFLRFVMHPGDDWFDPNGRVRFWAWTYARWMERPLFGFGPGSWLPNAPVFELRLTHAHCEYLEFLTEYGAIGALPLLASLWGFFRRFRLTWHHALCCGLLVNAVGNFPFHIASIATIFLTAWLLSVRQKHLVVSYRHHGG
jgi:O-antigen ligase